MKDSEFVFLPRERSLDRRTNPVTPQMATVGSKISVPTRELLFPSCPELEFLSGHQEREAVSGPGRGRMVA